MALPMQRFCFGAHRDLLSVPGELLTQRSSLRQNAVELAAV
jgi:hypothetical protein